MLQTVQGVKGPIERDVMLQCKGESVRCGRRDVTGERVHSGETCCYRQLKGKGFVRERRDVTVSARGKRVVRDRGYVTM